MSAQYQVGESYSSALITWNTVPILACVVIYGVVDRSVTGPRSSVVRTDCGASGTTSHMQTTEVELANPSLQFFLTITMSQNQEFSETFKKGLEVRGEVLGEQYVTKAVESLQNEYWKPAQELITEYAWGTVWTRPGLDRKQRSLLST